MSLSDTSHFVNRWRSGPKTMRIIWIQKTVKSAVGSLAQTEEQYNSFAAAQHKPHVLNDAIVDRAIWLYEEQRTSIPLHERRLN
jgi:hypothetical protein